MIYHMYCIYDKKAGLFGTPIYEINELTAKRKYEYLLTRQEELDPLDLDLYFVGTFDSEKGVIVCSGMPKFICGAPTTALKE